MLIAQINELQIMAQVIFTAHNPRCTTIATGCWISTVATMIRSSSYCFSAINARPLMLVAQIYKLCMVMPYAVF